MLTKRATKCRSLCWFFSWFVRALTHEVLRTAEGTACSGWTLLSHELALGCFGWISYLVVRLGTVHVCDCKFSKSNSSSTHGPVARGLTFEHTPLTVVQPREASLATDYAQLRFG